MDTNTYQEGTSTTAFPYQNGAEITVDTSSREFLIRRLRLDYLAMKLNGEAGEVAEELAKSIRDDEGTITGPRHVAIQKEIGDVMWYVSQLCNELGYDLGQILALNLEKLQSRKDRGVLGGSGSDR